MNDDTPPVNPANFDVARMNALLGQQPPPPQWGMAWFGGSAPYDRPAAPMGPAPSVLPVVGIGALCLSVLVTGGMVVAGHLNSTREAALRSARQEIASLRAERDRVQSTLAQAREQLKQIRTATATACQQQQEQLDKAAALFEATP